MSALCIVNKSLAISGQHSNGGKKGVLSDRIIKLNGYATSKKYPSKMRLVVFKDEEIGKVYHFITSNFRLAAATIALSINSAGRSNSSSRN